MATNTVSMNSYQVTFGHGTRLLVIPSKIAEIWVTELLSWKLQSPQSECLLGEQRAAVQKPLPKCSTSDLLVIAVSAGYCRAAEMLCRAIMGISQAVELPWARRCKTDNLCRCNLLCHCM